jgi:hypothetical protein
MFLDIPFLADWNKIGEYRQHQTDLNTKCENKTRVDYDYKGDKNYCAKMVSSAKLKAITKVIHGQSQWFVRMEQSGFNAETNLKD